MGLFKKQKGMFADLRNLTEALDPEQLSSMTSALTNPGEMAGLTGTVDPGLLQSGLLGRGLIISVDKTGTSVGSRHEPRPVCQFKVEVTLDNTPSYIAEFRQSVPLADVPQYVPGQTFIAVRVDPADHSRVAMDRSQEPPTVTISEQTTGAPSAASILESGNPVRAVVIQTQPLSAKNRAGLDLYAFVLTILEEGHPPRQVQAGNPVPAPCIPLLYPGSNLPAKVDADQPGLVAIDWDAALAEASK
ncbi:MAG TPA: hypothetical protein VHU17_17745 [Acidimicrobiales bacterium]|nr:hypothetical protein [Acidimicrobiales bacterium]